jgi:hypothetical protein
LDGRYRQIEADLLEYLLDIDAVGTMLAPYPSLRAYLGGLRTADSKAHPGSRWRVGNSRLCAFLARASRAENPNSKLRIVATALAATSHRTFSNAVAEDEFGPRLAQLLLVAALADSGFDFHTLPAASPKRPDVTGTFPGLGTLSAEVYKPFDEPSTDAYRSELCDGIELADVPWSYLADISWHTRPNRSCVRDRSYRERHRRIRDTVNVLFPKDGARYVDPSVSVRCADDELGLSATVRLVNVEPWPSPACGPSRGTIMGWNNAPWSMETHADAVANKITNKALLEQAQSRVADWRLLVVDCSTLSSAWDLSLTPDSHTIDALCSAVGSRQDEFPPGLNGIVVWNPNIWPGEARRVVAATEDVPRELLDALAGCRWKCFRSASGLLRSDLTGQ